MKAIIVWTWLTQQGIAMKSVFDSVVLTIHSQAKCLQKRFEALIKMLQVEIAYKLLYILYRLQYYLYGRQVWSLCPKWAGQDEHLEMATEKVIAV